MFPNWQISENHLLPLQKVQLMQYIPSKGVYVYFRYDDKQTILCALNSDTVSAYYSILTIIQKEPKALKQQWML